jgi:hypothetical protein
VAGVKVERSHSELREHDEVEFALGVGFLVCGVCFLASLAQQRLLLAVVTPKLADGRFESTAQREPSNRLETFMSSSS